MEKLNDTAIASVSDLRKNLNHVLNDLDKDDEIYIFNNNKPTAILMSVKKREREKQIMKEKEAEWRHALADVMNNFMENSPEFQQKPNVVKYDTKTKSYDFGYDLED